MRTADHVLHKPSGETWVVAYVEGDDLVACGWPVLAYSGPRRALGLGHYMTDAPKPSKRDVDCEAIERGVWGSCCAKCTIVVVPKFSLAHCNS